MTRVSNFPVRLAMVSLEIQREFSAAIGAKRLRLKLSVIGSGNEAVFGPQVLIAQH